MKTAAIMAMIMAALAQGIGGGVSATETYGAAQSGAAQRIQASIDEATK